MEKNALSRAIEIWGASQIDGFVSNPIIAKYTKNALHNFIYQNQQQIDGAASGIMMFLADEKGKINKEQAITDMIKMISTVDGKETEIFGAKITADAQGISVDLDNDLLRMVLGTSKFRFSDSDIKDLLSSVL